MYNTDCNIINAIMCEGAQEHVSREQDAKT
jgi:hypothetical protein